MVAFAHFSSKDRKKAQEPHTSNWRKREESEKGVRGLQVSI